MGQEENQNMDRENLIRRIAQLEQNEKHLQERITVWIERAEKLKNEGKLNNLLQFISTHLEAMYEQEKSRGARSNLTIEELKEGLAHTDDIRKQWESDYKCLQNIASNIIETLSLIHI
eukprot:TRINITY_DN17521_c0_g1_i1.p1 TRINITY_DN17521_c0_g1~~TRINITY_DN17521_c0_g1_i1.p1  ORF type:complete len:118 (+),score=20.04 TRINITY_DN17521_c0_g1_i1:434-787(+)